MHNLKDLRSNLDYFKKKLKERNVNFDSDNFSKKEISIYSFLSGVTPIISVKVPPWSILKFQLVSIAIILFTLSSYQYILKFKCTT